MATECTFKTPINYPIHSSEEDIKAAFMDTTICVECQGILSDPEDKRALQNIAFYVNGFNVADLLVFLIGIAESVSRTGSHSEKSLRKVSSCSTLIPHFTNSALLAMQKVDNERRSHS